MTSEVLMLNKDAVVIAADSAVTTGRAPHPRYSKAANKIFDLSVHGNVALTIYGNADVDRVPWELAVKLFRAADAKTTRRGKLLDYQSALLNFLQGNLGIFPVPVRDSVLQKRLLSAVIYLLGRVAELAPRFVDLSASAVDRQAAWGVGSTAVAADLAAKPIKPPLVNADFVAAQALIPQLQPDLSAELLGDPKYLYADAGVLLQQAAEAVVKEPENFLTSTGVVIAGYGDDEIFPSFTHLRVYGHIGGSLFWTSENQYAITHDNEAWIQPFAQSSMIERFTDGFDFSLTAINHQCGLDLIDRVLGDLSAGGVAVPAPLGAAVKTQRHTEFMMDFRQKNWNENFYPLRRVLNSLSVPEMGHLAESLLVLEALRERVTSPSESVGGPIDVAVVTKSEGLVWLKRKHYFEPELNLRYLNRSKI